MLRVIIFLKPQLEKDIINFKKVKNTMKERILESQKLEVDP